MFASCRLTTDVAAFKKVEDFLRLKGIGYSLKDKNEAKTDKIEHENGKSVKDQSRPLKILGKGGEGFANLAFIQPGGVGSSVDEMILAKVIEVGFAEESTDYQLCAIWKNLGYSEWSTPTGLKLARENLQSRVKEEDSITDVENAVFDLGVMDSLCFLFIDQRVLIGMITKFIKFIELNFSVITHGFDIKVCMLKGPVSFVLPSSMEDDRPSRYTNSVWRTPV
ncbi:hypothetical protein Tco_1419999 [Tanacetum coccineum]